MYKNRDATSAPPTVQIWSWFWLPSLHCHSLRQAGRADYVLCGSFFNQSAFLLVLSLGKNLLRFWVCPAGRILSGAREPSSWPTWWRYISCLRLSSAAQWETITVNSKLFFCEWSLLCSVSLLSKLFSGRCWKQGIYGTNKDWATMQNHNQQQCVYWDFTSGKIQN